MMKERQVQEAQAQLKAERKALEEAKELQRLAKENPLAFLEKSGVTYKELTDKYVKNVDPTAPFKSELEELKAWKAQQEEEARRYREEATIQDVRSEIHSFVESSEEFPLVKALGGHDLVSSRIIEHYRTTGEVKSEYDVARDVEAETREFVNKLLTMPQIQELVKAQVKQDPANVTPTEPQSKTLTNDHSAAAGLRADSAELSYAERRERAAALLRWKE